ncbi:MAG: Asp-tRNA(Asn)/Glu-tRNA(Gln) amidotransferase subunit GatC [bacterium]
MCIIGAARVNHNADDLENQQMSSNADHQSMDVNYVARLARMKLDAAEARQFQGQLDGIVDYVRQLAELDLEGVEPTAHAAPIQNVFREDLALSGLTQEQALVNAPAQSGGQFVVPKIVE